MVRAFSPSLIYVHESQGFAPNMGRALRPAQNRIQISLVSAESASLSQPGAQPRVRAQHQEPRAESPLHSYETDFAARPPRLILLLATVLRGPAARAHLYPIMPLKPTELCRCSIYRMISS